ncbi:MAG: sigma-70 family RNA polymerase sigma factor [Silvanigrellales bacterium]|jgi:RNA polymerase sigma-70 factor (ECF subfamily)|nr:sigma-70 family RNA polymerase sigma factor [Silvanigrellales bacterium]
MNALDPRHVAASVLTQEAFDAHFRLVAFTLRKMRVSEQDLEEMSQETFLRYFRHCLNIEPHAVKAWLVTTARNVALDAFNKAKRRKTDTSTDAATSAQSNVWNPDAAQEAARARAAETAMASLKEAARSQRFHILKDFYLGEKSVKEISAKRGIKVSSVTSALSRQRAQFVSNVRAKTF